MPVITGNEKYFTGTLLGIFAMIAGEALGSYYLYSESLNRLTPGVIRSEKIMDKMASYHEA